MPQHAMSHWIAAGVSLVSLLVGCATASPIQPVESSKSHFDGAVFDGESVTISSSTPGHEAYRVFHHAATGFVSVQSVRVSAEKRATEFCDREGRAMKALSETTSRPPHILGNFPRIEIVFECVDRSASTTSPASEDTKYTRLVNLKKLLDSGVLSQEEFDREKAKILDQP
jgi:hypothetical protein